MRRQLEIGFTTLGLRSLPCAGNFLMAEVGDAKGVHAALLAESIAVSTLETGGLQFVEGALQTVSGNTSIDWTVKSPRGFTLDAPEDTRFAASRFLPSGNDSDFSRPSGPMYRTR